MASIEENNSEWVAGYEPGTLKKAVTVVTKKIATTEAAYYALYIGGDLNASIRFQLMQGSLAGGESWITVIGKFGPKGRIEHQTSPKPVIGGSDVVITPGEWVFHIPVGISTVSVEEGTRVSCSELRGLRTKKKQEASRTTPSPRSNGSWSE